MAEFNFRKVVNASKLRRELTGDGIAAKFDVLKTKGDQVVVITKEDLIPTEITALNKLIADHVVKDDEAIAADDVTRGIKFSIELLSEIASFFMGRGLSNAELEIVSDRFEKFQQLLYGGYLPTAKAHLASIPTDALVPAQVITRIDKRMTEFLSTKGVTLSVAR